MILMNMKFKEQHLFEIEIISNINAFYYVW